MSDLSILIFIATVVLCVILKVLRIAEPASAPKLFFRRSQSDSFVDKIVRLCPILRERYVPPLLWGKNGHLHTFVFSKFSPRIECKSTRQHSVRLEDNSTVIFDVFEPNICSDEKLKVTGDYTIVVVPGIANGSSDAYVLHFCERATKLGYRVVVLNHLGVLPVKLTSNRIFTYGSTHELDAIVRHTVNNFPHTKLLGVGFSLGGNILVKYLGEDQKHQANFVCAISVCQGYDISKACPAFEEWDGLRRVYNWLITQKVKSVIKRHAQEVLGGCSTTPYQELQRNKVLTATSLKEIDKHFGRKMAGFESVNDYYKYSSCSNYIDKVEIPMLLVNSQDDPLIPEELLETPKKYVQRPNSKALFVLSQFGGHLGFYEGGLVRRHTQTWLNKVIFQYINAVLTGHFENE